MSVVPLDIEEEQRQSDLVHRLKQGEITIAEAYELRNLLEREKHRISQLGNCLAILAVTFLISYLDKYLESKNNSIVASEVKKAVGQ
jgi:predicted kinase